MENKKSQRINKMTKSMSVNDNLHLSTGKSADLLYNNQISDSCGTKMQGTE